MCCSVFYDLKHGYDAVQSCSPRDQDQEMVVEPEKYERESSVS